MPLSSVLGCFGGMLFDLEGVNCCDRGVGDLGVSVLWMPAVDSAGPMSGICGEGGCAAPAGADCFRPVRPGAHAPGCSIVSLLRSLAGAGDWGINRSAGQEKPRVSSSSALRWFSIAAAAGEIRDSVRVEAQVWLGGLVCWLARQLVVLFFGLRWSGVAVCSSRDGSPSVLRMFLIRLRLA